MLHTHLHPLQQWLKDYCPFLSSRMLITPAQCEALLDDYQNDMIDLLFSFRQLDLELMRVKIKSNEQKIKQLKVELKRRFE